MIHRRGRGGRGGVEYPTDYVLAQVVMLFVGYVLMGAVIAAIAKK